MFAKGKPRLAIELRLKDHEERSNGHNIKLIEIPMLTADLLLAL